MAANVLIIDDEDKLRGLLARIITLEGHKVAEAASVAAAWKCLEKDNIDGILCDVKLSDGNGVELTKKIKEKYPCTEVILMTAYGNIADGVKAIQNGAFDYLVKGDDNEKIIPLLDRAAEKISLRKKVRELERQLSVKYGFDNILGESAAIKSAVNLAKKVASTDASVLLTGETGTGKEVFAQAIHASSAVSNFPFIALNCSALSKDIMESELFGHKAGAFTGAVKDKKGLVEEAKGGTLFLDEIGEMPLELQPKLLRFLENGTYYRVGDTTQRSAKVRLIAATNRDLQAEIERSHFRGDLYYRIAVFSIVIPSLRERGKDISVLANYYLKVFAVKTGKQISGIDTIAGQAILQHNWPGNVRELKNVIERAVILEDGATLSLNSLPYELQHFATSIDGGGSVFQLATAEKLHIQKVLKHANGNKTEAARLLDIGLATLYRKIDEYGLKS